jgi:uncharacterized protein (TIGR03086 family)
MACGPDQWLCDGMSSDSATQVLSRGLDQLETVLRSVSQDDLARPTPCPDWTVSDLVDHVVQAPQRFAMMARGEQVDWAAPTPHADDPVAAYQENAQALRSALAEHPDSEVAPDWQCAEIAVHTWDLATALGRSTDTFYAEVADRGRAFMLASLNDDNRSPAFGPEMPAPEDADAYTRIAAFAGRTV